MMTDLPLVTAVCLTRNRREWLPKAIQAFQHQTYPGRQMLIVADGEDVRDLVPSDDERISLIVAPGERKPVGAKRNFACSLVSTELVAHWDDDDYSAPGRLEDQVVRLIESAKSVTGYHTMKFTDGERWWQYLGWPAFALGTSLVYRRAWWERNRFASIPVGEDSPFVSSAVRAREFVAAGDLDLMYATVHAKNTSPRRINTAGNWRELPDFEWRKAA
jgi:O-antigen biosynthesis protein